MQGELVDNTAGLRASLGGGSIKVAGGTADHTSIRDAAVRSSRETVKHCLVPRRIQLVYHTVTESACGATGGGGTKQVSGRVANNPCEGAAAIGAACKAV